MKFLHLLTLPFLVLTTLLPHPASSFLHTEETKAVQSLPHLSEPPRIARVPIFVYHLVRPAEPQDTRFLRQYLVTPDVFDAQMQYLSDNGYKTISFKALEEYLHGGAPLPPKPVIISFDDGWENQFTYAFPVLQKYGLSASFFVYTNAVEQPNHFTWEQLRGMERAGMQIEGHSKSHPFLAKITDPKKLQEEIAGSKKIMDEHLATTTDAFAYPFGSYNADTVAAVQAAGYTSARIFSSASMGELHDPADLYTLSSIPAPDSLSEFEKYAPQ